ncbi:hypothetical protein N8131_00180 [Flavobacteriaceae bacterium]|nr:hypothetical protein [Flavobacteriaceae bacterium]
MRIILIFLISLLATQLLVAQTVNDVNRFVSTELNGSARYTSMAGAFGALGGDLTAISFNPASSSVFLHSELGASISYKNKVSQSTYFNSNRSLENDDIQLDHFGSVFVFNNSDKESSWSRISAGINFHKIIQFNQKASVNGNNVNGIDQYFLYYANGIAFENLPLYENESTSEVYRVLGIEKGFGAQQSFLGYQGYVINPSVFSDANTEYVSNLEYNKVNHQLDIINKGFHRKTSLNLSGFYKNKVHLGVNINFHKLYLNNTQNLFESNHSLSSPTFNINFENDLISFGKGISSQIGAIFILKNTRLGLTYYSPQWLQINDETKQNISSFHYEEGSIIKDEIIPNITNQYDPYQIKIPSKTTFSFAYIFGVKGLISVDYSTQNMANTKLSDDSESNYLNDVTGEIKSTLDTFNTLRIGAEYRLQDVSFRAGILNQNVQKNNNRKKNMALTFGLGLDFGASSLSISLVNFEQNKKFDLFSEGLTDTYSLSQKLTQISISYNYKL